MKGTRKTIAVSAIIAALFLVSAIRGSAAALPSWMPAQDQLAGYKLVWDNTISVKWFVNQNVNGNVTCSSQVWLKNGTSGLVDANVIGASMIDKGGNVFAKPVDLSKNDLGTIAAKALLSGAGLNESQIASIQTVWDIVVEILRIHQGTTYTLTEPAIPNVDHAVMLGFSAGTDFKYALFCTRQDHCMVVYSFNASQDWITWLNSTGTSSLILAKMQVITWAFWLILATYVTVIVQLANFLGVSDAPATLGESSSPAPSPAMVVAPSSAIQATAYTPTTDLMAFASAWGALFPNFPWLLVISIVVGAVVVIIVVSAVRRHRKK